MIKFGFAREDITPVRGVPLSGYFEPRYNRGARDPLAVKAALFDDGSGVCGIVNYDLCGVPGKLCNRFIDALQKNGIDFGKRLMFCATHTHTGPYTTESEHVDANYIDSLVARTVTAVQRAAASLADAELLTGRTECSTLAFNRRFWMKNGGVLTNPGKLNPDIVGPEGPIDPEIPILAVRQDGLLRLIIANISNHSDTIGEDLVSADWPGRMEREIQTAVGYDLPVIMMVACQGNINHFNVKNAVNQTCYEEACRIGKGYAHEIISQLYALTPIKADKIKVAETEIEIPYVQITDEEYAAAKATYDSIGEIKAACADDLTSEGLAKGNPYVLRHFAKRIMDCRDNPIKTRRVDRMITLQFGDELGIVSIPGEPFIEIQLAIKAKSRFALTMVGALALGYPGYIGMPESYARGGGYETRPSPSAPAHDVAPKIIEKAIGLLQ